MEKASGRAMNALGSSPCCVNSGRRALSLLACGGTTTKHVQARSARFPGESTNFQSLRGRRDGTASAGTRGSRAETSKTVARAGGPKGESFSQEAVLRSEAEAPFRVFRIACYAALAVSAGLGGLIAMVRVIAGFAKGEIMISSILASEDCTGLAIDLVALSVLVYLYRKETGEREKQIKRLQREVSLGQLKVEINLKKPRLVTLQQLQGFARTVVVAGDEEFLLEAVKEAAEVKDMIKDRSICIIPLVLRGRQPDVSQLSELISDPEVLLSPILVDQWKAWMTDQMEEAGVEYGKNVYIGLRMDGRVRASGKGLPPWKKFVAELTPKEGIWSSDFMKGFDGRV